MRAGELQRARCCSRPGLLPLSDEVPSVVGKFGQLLRLIHPVGVFFPKLLLRPTPVGVVLVGKLELREGGHLSLSVACLCDSKSILCVPGIDPSVVCRLIAVGVVAVRWILRRNENVA